METLDNTVQTSVDQGGSNHNTGNDVNTTAASSHNGSMQEFGKALDDAANRRVTQPKEDAPEEVTPQLTRQQNNINAQRRIANKRNRMNLERRIAELEQQLSQYEGKTDDASKVAAQHIADRIDDMQSINADNTYNDFSDRAAEVFTEDAHAKFMADTQRYAQYVNKNEPEVLSYLERGPAGLILLREWYARMDNQKTREQWLSFTSYEKGRALANLFNNVNNMLNNRGGSDTNAGTPAPTTTPNAPVPGSGRSAGSDVASDDFAVALQNAENRRRR